MASLDAETRETLRRLVDEQTRAQIASGVARVTMHEPLTEEREVPGFGARIRECRLAQGLSQHGLGRRGRPLMQNTTVCQIESGAKTNPALSTLWGLAAALNLRITITAEGIEIALRGPIRRPSRLNGANSG